MATIVKTPSGTWKAFIRKTGWPPTAKTFRTKRDAEDWSRRTEDEMVRGVYIQRGPAERMTVEVALNRYACPTTADYPELRLISPVIGAFMTTEEFLLGRFGPLMSITDVAGILGRSADGFRVALYSDGDVSRRLRPTMVRIGRRVYFRTLQLADALGLDSPEANGNRRTIKGDPLSPKSLISYVPQTHATPSMEGALSIPTPAAASVAWRAGQSGG